MFKSNNSDREFGESFSEPNKYETEMELIKGKGKFSDIVLSSKVEFGDQHRDVDKWYIFNGLKYVEEKK